MHYGPSARWRRRPTIILTGNHTLLDRLIARFHGVSLSEFFLRYAVTAVLRLRTIFASSLRFLGGHESRKDRVVARRTVVVGIHIKSPRPAVAATKNLAKAEIRLISTRESDSRIPPREYFLDCIVLGAPLVKDIHDATVQVNHVLRHSPSRH